MREGFRSTFKRKAEVFRRDGGAQQLGVGCEGVGFRVRKGLGFRVQG